MRVLFVCTYFSRGGAERVVSTLLKFLDRSVVAPAICVLRHDEGYPVPQDVPVRHLGFDRYWQLPRTVKRLRALIEAETPDVVVGNVNTTNLVVGEALRKCGVQPRWIARIGNNPNLDRSLLRDLMEKRVFPRVDRWVVNSVGLSREVRSCFSFAQGKIDVLLNPVDFAEIDRLAEETPAQTHAGDEPLLIAVGRLARQKRYDLLIEAVAGLRERLPATLWVCGEGPERSALERQIERFGLAGRIKLLGHCSNPFPLMRQADLFVMTSDYEGSPNALIEAQGLGIPAVSTRCPAGPDEIVADGVTGFLVRRGSASSFRDSIQRVLESENCLEKMGSAARERTRRVFDLHRAVEAWEKTLNELGGEGSRGKTV